MWPHVHTYETSTQESLESRKVDVEYGKEEWNDRGNARSRVGEGERGREEGGGLENPRGRILYVCACSVRVCIKDRWLVRTQLNESKADYAAGLEPHKSSI